MARFLSPSGTLTVIYKASPASSEGAGPSLVVVVATRVCDVEVIAGKTPVEVDTTAPEDGADVPPLDAEVGTELLVPDDSEDIMDIEPNEVLSSVGCIVGSPSVDAAEDVLCPGSMLAPLVGRVMLTKERLPASYVMTVVTR